MTALVFVRARHWIEVFADALFDEGARPSFDLMAVIKDVLLYPITELFGRPCVLDAQQFRASCPLGKSEHGRCFACAMMVQAEQRPFIGALLKVMDSHHSALPLFAHDAISIF